MITRFATLVVMFASSTLVAHAHPSDEVVVLPSTLVLDGEHAAQRVLVESRGPMGFSGDLTTQAEFAIDDPRVARVSAEGVVTPLQDGEATLTARVGESAAAARIQVTGMNLAHPWSFRNHVLPVLTRLGCNAGSCHGSAAGKNGLRLTLRGYGPEVDHAVLTRQAFARRMNKSAPSESLFLFKPTGALPHGGGRLLDPASLEFRVLSEWIATGMVGPSDSDATIQRIEAIPDSVTLAPGQTQQVLVRAHYSDGRVEDVTAWSKFESTDVSVLKVDESGRVTVQAPGAAAVSVWFSSLVDMASVLVPRAEPVDPSHFEQAPRHNRIDELNLARLKTLNIPPSPPSDDASFLRRASLDATGTLPDIEAVDAFLANADPDKRARLVDRLLESPEFVDYWAYKWSDVLLVSSKKLASPAVWSFYRFVREAVSENLPWDEFARRIVTARGSTLTNGAANYFVLHRDPIDLTENTSVAFLGLSLTCARCHNHPMEKWTQDQYYGMANLFARVSLKDGVGANGSVTAGDVVVSAAVDGDIVHPRRGVVMPPQPLDAPALDPRARDDRRLAFAGWLASPSNPYFDRAIINRVWANFFGRGIIDPEDDLRATNPPSDPELLNWLVEDFRAHGRDVKHLIRTIMNSAAYARSAEPVPGNEHDTKFLSHCIPRRLSAEVLLDAVCEVTQVPTVFAGYPEGWRSVQLPDSKIENAFLDSFGRPAREAVCSCERSSEPSVSQALHLANGTTLNDKLRDDKGIVARLVRDAVEDAQVLDTLFKSALSRPPSPSERDQLLPLLAEAVEGVNDPAQAQAARRQAIEDLYWAVLTSKEFLFNH